MESWKAYCRLFDCVLNEGEREGVGGVGGLVLPSVWLWDMVDEFIYQFQSFCQFRGKLQAKSEKEIERLKELKDEDDVWQKEKVEAYLEALQNKRKEKAEAGNRRKVLFERRRRIRREEGEKKQRFGHFGILCHRWFGESPVFVGGLRVVFEDLLLKVADFAILPSSLRDS